MQEKFGQGLLTQRTVRITRKPEDTVIRVLLKELHEGWGPYPADEKMWKWDKAMFVMVIHMILWMC